MLRLESSIDLRKMKSRLDPFKGYRRLFRFGWLSGGGLLVFEIDEDPVFFNFSFASDGLRAHGAIAARLTRGSRGTILRRPAPL